MSAAEVRHQRTSTKNCNAQQWGLECPPTKNKYKPFKIDPIQVSEFRLYDPDLEADKAEKDQVCRIVGNIRYFYFIDPHGVQWEFEQGHAGIGTDTGPEPEPDIDAQNGE